jgi:hypothetical protein
LKVPDELDDFKVFERKPDAEKRFLAGWFKIENYKDACAALYQVDDVPSPRDAVEAVKGREKKVVLLESRPMDFDKYIDLLDLDL